MLECVINISEGSDTSIIEALSAAAGGSLLDVHRDEHHNRSVFTLAGPLVEGDARRVATVAAERIDYSNHAGAHPRIGAIDVVPFVPLTDTGANFADALAARNGFARWMVKALEIPCFFYGPERSLPEVRRRAFSDLAPDLGALKPDVHSGACAVGARNYLIAYNLWMKDTSIEEARTIAKSLRSDQVRSLALQLGDQVQISCNLIEPLGKRGVGPAQVFDAVAAQAEVERAELVGLLPAAALKQIPTSRWEELDVGTDRTIENRLLSS